MATLSKHGHEVGRFASDPTRKYPVYSVRSTGAVLWKMSAEGVWRVYISAAKARANKDTPDDFMAWFRHRGFKRL